MMFNSISFLVFFTATAILFFLIPHRWRWLLLLAASYLFYGYGRPGYLGLIMATTWVSFWFAKHIQAADRRRKKRLQLGLCVGFNLFILFLFKYFNFFSDSMQSLFNAIHATVPIPHVDLLLPLGLSFYTLRIIGYLIDVYRNDIEAERHLGIFSVYVAFFPQLIAGPIERSPHLLPQFYREQRFDYGKFREGFSFMLWGFFMKLVIADRIAVYVNAIFNNPQLYTGGHCLLAAYLFTFQIYCDFAGYSMIAIGVSRIFGYDIVENFRHPYFSQSLQEFWTRWHISLSTWFRDYLYIPLGGNRVPMLRHQANLGIVFLVSGLWHGANWTFLIWGGLHGLGLIFGQITSTFRKRFLEGIVLTPYNRIAALFKVVITFHLVCMAWIFFRADSVPHAWSFIRNLPRGWRLDLNYLGSVILPFTDDNSAISVFLTSLFFIALMLVVDFIDETGNRRIVDLWRNSSSFNILCLITLALAILFFGEFKSGSFIYSKF
jgi:alginate O-acetyltransferase complex protein AlgI